MYDYLLVVGPGRSGSEYLYRILREHPDYAFPEIKEAAYYRSLRRFGRALATVRPGARMLCDVANEAYRDPALLPGVRALQAEGHSVLLMVLLRDHRDRAISMMRFRESRGEPAALFGRRRLESLTVRDRLTERRLAGVFALDVDVLTVNFPTLVGETPRVLDALCSLCRTTSIAWSDFAPVNEATRARLVWLSSAGWLFGAALRKLGFNRLLQRIKDTPLVSKMFFRPLAPNDRNIHLGETSIRILEESNRECRSLVENASEELGDGIYLRRSGR